MDKIKINKQTKRSLKNKMEYFKENIFRDKKRNQKYKQDKGLFWNKRIKRMLCCRNQLLRKAFLSLLAILWYSAFKWVYISFSPLLFASLLFTVICKASPDRIIKEGWKGVTQEWHVGAPKEAGSAGTRKANLKEE